MLNKFGDKSISVAKTWRSITLVLIGLAVEST
jgi:hypothetical protein